MVSKETAIFLLIGEDPSSKDLQIKKIKQQFLNPQTQDFNLDLFYAKELSLVKLQERMLSLPLKSQKRIIVIKEAQHLKEDIRDFLLDYARQQHPSLVIILDIMRGNHKDAFLNNIRKYAKAMHFKESVYEDTFALARQIETRRADYSLRLLSRLLEQGEKPERILGGLRFAWERSSVYNNSQARKRLRLLLNCDIDIKTGRLRPDFALEKLVIALCNLAQPFG